MSLRNKPIVAIDGPAGAGKSTISKMTAIRLGYTYIDTGAMYRTVTLKAMQDQVNLADQEAVERVAERIDMAFVPGAVGEVMLDGQNVSQAIRTPEVSRNVSAYVASYSGVRKVLVALQQAMGKEGGVVMEGRDITTVVFPDAEVKIYLDAGQEERARRRYEELKAKGQEQDFNELLDDLKKRDLEDMNRPGGALQCVDDAVKIDSTGLTVDEVVNKIVEVVKAGETV